VRYYCTCVRYYCTLVRYYCTFSVLLLHISTLPLLISALLLHISTLPAHISALLLHIHALLLHICTLLLHIHALLCTLVRCYCTLGRYTPALPWPSGSELSCGCMGCWGAGVLGCWGAGVLGCWGAGVLGCWGAGVLGAGVLGCWGAGVLGCWGAGVLGCWGAGVLGAGVLGCWGAGVLGMLGCWGAGVLGCWVLGRVPAGPFKSMRSITPRPSASRITYFYRKSFTIQDSACYPSLALDFFPTPGLVACLTALEVSLQPPQGNISSWTKVGRTSQKHTPGTPVPARPHAGTPWVHRRPVSAATTGAPCVAQVAGPLSLSLPCCVLPSCPFAGAEPELIPPATSPAPSARRGEPWREAGGPGGGQELHVL